MDGSGRLVRSDGTVIVTVSWIAFAAGIIAVPMHFLMAGGGYGAVELSIAALVAYCAFPIWAMLWSVGTIVQAIYFLPGDAEKLASSPRTSVLAPKDTM